METARFEEIDGRTRLTVTSRFDTQEDRDGMLASGMEGGLNDTYDRFEALLARGA